MTRQIMHSKSISTRRIATVCTLASLAIVIGLVHSLEAVAWQLVVVGDSRGDQCGVNATILGEMALAIVNERVECVLFPGDLVSGNVDQEHLQSQLAAWKDAMQPVYKAGIDVYAIRGNHETAHDNSTNAWNAVFSGRHAMPRNGPAGEVGVTYSTVHHNALIVGLDQYGSHPHRVNQVWLQQQLAANTMPHVFVMGHEPAFRLHHADCMDNQPADRNTFWNYLAAAGGRVYFAGHDHMYNHARIDDGDGNPANDLHQFVVGTAGAPLYSFDGNYIGNNAPFAPIGIHNESQYGYLLVTIDDLAVTMTWKHRTVPGVYSATTDIFRYAARRPSGRP